MKVNTHVVVLASARGPPFGSYLSCLDGRMRPWPIFPVRFAHCKDTQQWARRLDDSAMAATGHPSTRGSCRAAARARRGAVPGGCCASADRPCGRRAPHICQVDVTGCSAQRVVVACNTFDLFEMCTDAHPCWAGLVCCQGLVQKWSLTSCAPCRPGVRAALAAAPVELRIVVPACRACRVTSSSYQVVAQTQSQRACMHVQAFDRAASPLGEASAAKKQRHGNGRCAALLLGSRRLA